MASNSNVVIHWFRRDFRFYDNTALIAALNSGHSVLPIFIFDPNILARLEDKQDTRVTFIYDKVQVLKDELEENGSSLRVFYSSPEEVFSQLNQEYTIKGVYSNKDYEPYAIKRDKMIKDLLSQQEIPFHQFKDHVVFEGSEVLKQDGTPFKVFSPFKRAWLNRFEQPGTVKTTEMADFRFFHAMDPTESPSLKSMGFNRSDQEIPSPSVPIDLIRNYDMTRDFPGQHGTSRLGIHFRFGTVSIREYALLAKQYNDTFLNELIWRDFYSAILQHFPHVTDRAFNRKYDAVPWLNDPKEFEKWCAGQTGYPIVDAGMRELNQTGFMHNRARMITASFLTKHLLIDWRWGEAYFASKLLDFDLASNNGGWQWAAGTGTDAQPYFRVFNPASQAEKFDKQGDYIKNWVPEYGGSNYAKPMVEHKSARLRAIETYKAAVSK